MQAVKCRKRVKSIETLLYNKDKHKLFAHTQVLLRCGSGNYLKSESRTCKGNGSR